MRLSSNFLQQKKKKRTKAKKEYLLVDFIINHGALGTPPSTVRVYKYLFNPIALPTGSK